MRKAGGRFEMRWVITKGSKMLQNSPKRGKAEWIALFPMPMKKIKDIPSSDLRKEDGKLDMRCG